MLTLFLDEWLRDGIEIRLHDDEFQARRTDCIQSPQSDDIYIFLDQSTEDRTASRTEEGEGEGMRAANDLILPVRTPSRTSSFTSVDLGDEEDAITAAPPEEVLAVAETNNIRFGSPVGRCDWFYPGTLFEDITDDRAEWGFSQSPSLGVDDSDSSDSDSSGSDSIDSCRSALQLALHRATIFTDHALRDRLARYRIRIQSHPRRMSEPISPKSNISR